MASGSAPQRNIRLQGRTSASLNNAGSAGEIFWDSTTNALRLYNGQIVGGRVIADRVWVQSQIDNIDTFSGNYNDLTNKPVIPSLTGYATESYVTQAISGIDLTGYATETYVSTALSGYATETYVSTALTGYATESYVTSALGDVSVDLTGYATESYVTTAISNLIDTAPTTLNTLNELAAALGDDANFASTVTTALGNKAPLNSPSFTGTTEITGDDNRLVIDSTQTIFTSSYNDTPPVNIKPSALDYNYTAVNLAPMIGDVRIATNASSRLTLDCSVAWGQSNANFDIYGYGQINLDSSVSTYRGVIKKFKATDIEFENTCEVMTSLTGATGVVAHNYNSGTVFYHSSISGNFTANFTNMPTTTNRVISMTLILSQGATSYIPSAVQINGTSQSIQWFTGTTPTGLANKVDIVTFNIIRTSGGAWTVLGSLSTFG
jgi:hypothetical protein